MRPTQPNGVKGDDFFNHIWISKMITIKEKEQKDTQGSREKTRSKIRPKIVGGYRVEAKILKN